MLACLFMSACDVVLACDRGKAIAVSSAPMARYHVRRCRTQSSHHARRGKIKDAANIEHPHEQDNPGHALRKCQRSKIGKLMKMLGYIRSYKEMLKPYETV